MKTNETMIYFLLVTFLKKKKSNESIVFREIV